MNPSRFRFVPLVALVACAPSASKPSEPLSQGPCLIGPAVSRDAASSKFAGGRERTGPSEAPLMVAVAATTAKPPPPATVPVVASVAEFPDRVVEEVCARATGPQPDDQLFRGACAAYPSDAADARKKLFEIIAKFPSSEHAPAAYLFFGELFFRDAESGDRSKYELARQAYEKVLLPTHRKPPFS